MYIRTAAAPELHWKRSRGRKLVAELGAGEILLTSMDADGTKMATTSS
jgi:imidazole glycerol phosphate synthase subunit HisF